MALTVVLVLALLLLQVGERVIARSDFLQKKMTQVNFWNKNKKKKKRKIKSRINL